MILSLLWNKEYKSSSQETAINTDAMKEYGDSLCKGYLSTHRAARGPRTKDSKLDPRPADLVLIYHLSLGGKTID